MKNSGQSTVEYILLFAVIASLSMAVLRGRWMSDLLGPEGSFIEVYRRLTEYTYRHGRFGITETTPPAAAINGGTLHESYHNAEQSSSRFFGPLNPYGE